MKTNEIYLVIICFGIIIICALLALFLPDIIHNQEEIIKLLEKANEHSFELKI